MKHVAAAVAGVLAMTAGCNDVAGPAGARIYLSAVPELTDTISSVILFPVRFQVRDARGRPVADTRVLLYPSSNASGADTVPRVYLTSGRLFATLRDAVEELPYSPYPPAHTTQVLTDGQGRAAAYARLGVKAGDAYLMALHDDYRDSVLFRVRPGARAGLGALPADTAIMVGDSYPLAVFEVDRAGNRRDADAEATVVSSAPDVVQTTASTVNALAHGRASLDLTSSIGSARVHVSVVPDAVLAMAAPEWRLNGMPVVTTTNGVSVQTLPAATGLSCPAWHPDGERLLFEGLGIVNPAGNLSRVALDRQGLIAGCGRFSADGEWIYFDGWLNSDSADASQIWRVRPDGTSLEQITFSEGVPAWGASSSPDGARIAYSSGGRGLADAVNLIVLDLASGVADTIIRVEPYSSGNRHALRAVWSPTGEWIAYTHYFGDGSYRHEGRSYILLDRIALIRPDGSGNHDLPNTRVRKEDGVSWSPDGEWLAAAGDQHDLPLKLYNIADPKALPLNGSTYGFLQPAWRP